MLEEIKRKVPRVIKQSKKENEQKLCIQMNPSSGLSNSLEEIQAMADIMVNEIEQLQTSRTALESSISKLTQRDKDIKNEFKKLNASLSSKDNLIKDFLELIKRTAGDGKYKDTK